MSKALSPGNAVVVSCALLVLALPGVLAEGEGGTKLGIASFSLQEVTFEEGYTRVKLQYDATICGNPWQGGIYGYGEIERLVECRAKVYYFSEDDQDRAEALVAAAASVRGFSVIGMRSIHDAAPENTTYLVSWDDKTQRFNESSPLSGSVELIIDPPSFIKYATEKKTYHLVVLADIVYDAFNGRWTNLDGSGVHTVEAGEDRDQLSLRIESPAEVDADAGGISFVLRVEGKEFTKDKVDHVAWRFSYAGKDGYVDLDPVGGGLSDLEIPDAEMRRWRSITIENGRYLNQRYVLNMRVKAEAYHGDEILATSNTASFQAVAVEALRLSLDGPETVDAKAEQTTFSLSVEGDDETKNKVDEVFWVFSYPDSAGKWVDYVWHREEKLSDLTISKMDGGIVDYWYDMVLVSGESVGATKRLQMRVTAEAKANSRVLGTSAPHSFWITAQGLEVETNLSGSYDVYPTWPTVSTIEILYDGSKPIRLDFEGTMPACIDVSFDPQVIEPEEGEELGVYYSNITIAFDARKAPGISLPQQHTIKVTAEGMDVKYERNVALKLLPAKWLVMIYMAFDTKPDLLAAAIEYMATLLEIFRDKSVPEVGLIVLFDTTPKNDADLFTYRKAKDQSNINVKISSWGPTNMSDAKTLRRFLTEAMKTVPAQRNLLMIDAHGAGIRGIVYDENQGGSKHPMKFQPMLEALSGIPIELIAFNSCLMSQAEVLHHLSSAAPYVIASELTMPGSGLDLDGLFMALFENPDRGAEDVAKILVDTYKQRQDRHFRSNTSLSAVRSDKLAALALAVDGLAKELLKGYRSGNAQFNRTLAEIGSKTEMVDAGYPYGDIKDFAQRISSDQRIAEPTIKAAADKVARAVDDAIVSEAENIWVLRMKELRFEKTNKNGYNGMSIFLWNYRLEGDEGKAYRNFLKHFDETSFSTVTAWGQFLEQFAKSVPRTTRAVHLKHLLHELHLHIYDQDGHHVGYNASSTDRTRIDCGIPGAIYSDLGNGSKIILLPEGVTEYTVVVDGQDMEELEEPYTLTNTLAVDGQVVDRVTVDGTIREDTSHSTDVKVVGDRLEVSATVVEGELEGRLPEWFTENLPFLIPLVRPFLPLVPDSVIPILPFIVIGIPIILLVGLGIIARSRGRKGGDEASRHE